jgi:hypothetical protein
LQLREAIAGIDKVAVGLDSAALAQFTAAAGPDHSQLGHVLNNLATLHRRRGEDDQARRLLARAHALLLRTLGADHPVTVQVAGNRARVEATPSPVRLILMPHLLRADSRGRIPRLAFDVTFAEVDDAQGPLRISRQTG